MGRLLRIPPLLLLLLLLASACTRSYASSGEDDFKHCKTIVKKWASSSLHSDVKDGHILKDLLFFLHVPRTGGRTYFHCFLKKLYSTALECPRSYDKLRLDPSKPNCRILVTHDDYSIMSKLPREKTSVVTILRNPIDRVFSAYEFSIEVAARFLMHPNLTSATRMSESLKRKAGRVSTLDIWPWKYLVPWMIEDLFARRDARRRTGSTTISNNSYDMEEMAMPLHDYINDPIALDIVHNGATFQVAGLTNNSNLGEAHEVRHCVTKYQGLGKFVLDVAKKRLDDMLYVGLTEDHRESATMFANVVGAQVIAQLVASDATNNKSEQGSSFLDSLSDASDQNNSINSKSMKVSATVEATNDTMTVAKLMEAYETCIPGLRKSQAERRTKSLNRISPANFTKEARTQVPEAILKEIESLNSLDVELYKHAKDIFAKQHRNMQQNKLDSVTLGRWHKMLENKYINSSWTALWVSAFILLFVLYLFVNARRKTKLKI